MGISSLVLTLAADPAGRAALVAALEADPRFLLGSPLHLDGATRLPVVVDTAGDADHGALLEALARDPGAALVTLVFHHYDAHAPEQAAPDAAEEPRA